ERRHGKLLPPRGFAARQNLTPVSRPAPAPCQPGRRAAFHAGERARSLAGSVLPSRGRAIERRVAGVSDLARSSSEKRSGQSDEKGPAARRRPRAAREAYSLYVERAAEGA